MRIILALIVLAAIAFWLAGGSCPFAEAKAAQATQATPYRMAIIVGNNLAGPYKTPLSYAELDANRMANVLKDLGRIDKVELLVGKSADDLRRILKDLSISAQDSQNSILFFYYSGHADQNALMMGQSRFPFKELRNKLKEFPSDAAIAFIDACQSGYLARAKGGKHVRAVDVRFDGGDYKGRVFVTSSAAGENSQESDELRASFFTHYLLGALRGAADDSGDGRVSLEEAYQFAYRHTLAKTSNTLEGPQHPSYRMDLTGKGQLVLTWLSPKESYLVIPKEAIGTYFVRQKPTNSIVAEVIKTQPNRMRLVLSPGLYEVRKIKGNHHLVQNVKIAAAKETEIDESSMSKQMPEIALAKYGGDGENLLFVGYNFGTGYLHQSGFIHGLSLGYAQSIGPIELGGRVSYGNSGYLRNDQINVNLHELNLAATIDWRIRKWKSARLVTGLDIGGSWVWQKGTNFDGQIENNNQPVFRYDLRLGFEIPIVSPFLIGLWAHAGQVVLEKTSGAAAPFVLGIGASIITNL